MKKFIIPAFVFAIVLIAVIFFFTRRKHVAEGEIVRIRKGEFISYVMTTGELQAKNSVFIEGPSSLYQFQIYQLTVSKIVDEGTVVKKGDWVADLDRSEFNTKLQDTQLELEKAESKYVQQQLDTALEMRKSRNDLINLRYAVEEAKLVLEQSQYEPPATIKQDEFDLEKAQRALEQAQENYKIKTRQNIAKMQEANADYQKNRRRLIEMEKVADQFRITAPEDGMVIYAKRWDNTTIKEGSQIWVWNPTVATLPDLSSMVSKTYINEVDVRKVKPGQLVELGLDAFPDKKLNGVVISVANVGEQRPNSDAKVFEAIIQIDSTDYSIRPSMTTSNRIIVQRLQQVISIPLECIHTESDSISYVYKKSGFKTVRQEVETGPLNNEAQVIIQGLEEGDRIFRDIPAGLEEEPVTLLTSLNGKRNFKSMKSSGDVSNEAVVSRE